MAATCCRPTKPHLSLVASNLQLLSCREKWLVGSFHFTSIPLYILFLEETSTVEGEATLGIFDRMLQSLMQSAGFKHVQGIVFGRFGSKAEINNRQLIHMIHSKPELHTIPVIANCDFGHTFPQFTFPIGGTCKLQSGKNPRIEIIEH